MVVVLAFVFGHILPLHIPDYPAFLVVGLLPWAWFQSSLVGGTASVAGARDLVRQPGFPIPLLPVVAISTTLMNYVLSMPVMFLVLGHYSKIHGTAIALPLVIAVQFLITLGPCYVLSAINVRFRDVGHIVEIALLPLFYATPVFYRTPTAKFQLIFKLNPMAHVMTAYRAILLDGHWPDMRALAILAGGAMVVVLLAYRLFERLSVHFAEEL